MDLVDHYFLKPKPARPGPRRSQARYPSFDIAHVRKCIEALEDTPKWDEGEYLRRLRRYRFLINFPTYLCGAVMLIAYYLVQQRSVLVTLDHLSAKLRQYMDGLPLGVQVAAFFFGAFAVIRMSYTTKGIRPRAQFFRAVERAVRNATMKTHPQAPIIALNYVGEAAKCLFADLRRGRAHTAPPAVSDWAEGVARCLIDVRMMQSDSSGDRTTSIADYAQFIYDAATLVAVRREGLIPTLRKKYEPLLPIPNDDSFDERNTLFLNPLRGHPRWIFVKDFVYPLAAWLSLPVSVVALALTALK